MENFIPIGGRQTINPQEVISLKGEKEYIAYLFSKQRNLQCFGTTRKPIK
jgi:hypothetical protein